MDDLVLSPASCFFCQALTTCEPNPYLGAPVCSIYCVRSAPYSSANQHVAGTSDGFPMFSVEFEICGCGYALSREHRSLAEYAQVLTRHGFLRTEDGSVEDEYKSPRYVGLDAFLSVLPILERLKTVVDGCCGTHIHIDCPALSQVQRSISSLFGPLRQHMRDHEEETMGFWGRKYQPLVNTHTRYKTIEFRRPRFRSAAQYLPVVQFCRAVGACLNLRLNVCHPTYDPRTPSQIGEELLTSYLQLVASPGSVSVPVC